MASHFRHYLRVASRKPDDPLDTDVDVDAENDLYTKAEDYFLQLFCTQSAFADDKLAETLGKGASCDGKLAMGKLNTALNHLWVSLGLSEDNPSLRFAADTTKTLNVQLERFTESRSRGQEALWPLVQIVRTYFDCPFLKQGLIVADCPGLTDSTEQRRIAPRHYLSLIHI